MWCSSTACGIQETWLASATQPRPFAGASLFLRGVMPRVPKASAASPLSHRPRKPPSTRHETAHPPGGPEVTRLAVAAALGNPDSLKPPPFSTPGAPVDFHMATIQCSLFRRIKRTSHRLEYLLPNSLLTPAG